jgi:hypothetical protein
MGCRRSAGSMSGVRKPRRSHGAAGPCGELGGGAIKLFAAHPSLIPKRDGEDCPQSTGLRLDS